MRRVNDGIEKMYGNANILGVVREQKLLWLGRIQRMYDARLRNKILNTIFGEQTGRPKLRGRADVESDLNC